MTFLGSLLLWIVAIAILGWAFCFAVARWHDGPLGPVPGGALRRGPIAPFGDLAAHFGDGLTLAEIQSLQPEQSRTTGLIEHEGQFYIPCDLGFIWRRTHPPTRWLMAFVWRVKRWHEDVLRDGRIMIRLGDHRFALSAARVSDPDRIEALKQHVDTQAQQFLSGRLEPRPGSPGHRDEDGEIWFFRLGERVGEDAPAQA